MQSKVGLLVMLHCAGFQYKWEWTFQYKRTGEQHGSVTRLYPKKPGFCSQETTAWPGLLTKLGLKKLGFCLLCKSFPLCLPLPTLSTCTGSYLGHSLAFSLGYDHYPISLARILHVCICFVFPGCSTRLPNLASSLCFFTQSPKCLQSLSSLLPASLSTTEAQARHSKYLINQPLPPKFAG